MLLPITLSLRHSYLTLLLRNFPKWSQGEKSAKKTMPNTNVNPRTFRANRGSFIADGVNVVGDANELMETDRNSCEQMFFKIDVLKNFAILAGNHLC